MRSFWSSTLTAVALFATLDSRPALAQGGVVGRAGREAAEWAARRLGVGAARAGKDALAKRAETLAARHGDDILTASRRLGPEPLRRLEAAGEHGSEAARLLARHGEPATRLVANPRRLALCAAHGDEAALALIRHGGLAETVIARLGRPPARALAALGPRQARRMAMLAEEGELARIGRTPELLAVIARFGDRAMAFVWDHKGALAVSATLASFLADPRPFLNGAKGLAGAVARPLADASRRVATEVARGVAWRRVTLCGATVIAAAVVLRRPRRPQR